MVRDELTDSAAIALAQQGDRNAFGVLVRRYQDRVYRFVLRMVGSHDDALELTQEAFVKAWQALPEWQPDAQFRTWLFRIAANAATDALRRRKVVQFVALDTDYDAPDGGLAPEAQLQAKQQLKDLNVELGIMAFVLQFAPQDFVTIPKHGTIQYHPSLLPKYRGPSSINWPIIRGDTKTGLTIFRPTDGLDEGPVILQKETPIGPDLAARMLATSTTP